VDALAADEPTRPKFRVSLIMDDVLIFVVVVYCDLRLVHCCDLETDSVGEIELLQPQTTTTHNIIVMDPNPINTRSDQEFAHDRRLYHTPIHQFKLHLLITTPYPLYTCR